MQTELALPLKTNVQVQSDASVELLCGRFRYAQGAGQLLTGWLPEVLHVNLGAVAPDSGLPVLLQWLRAEAQGASRPGAHAVIDGLGQALLALALRAAPRRRCLLVCCRCWAMRGWLHRCAPFSMRRAGAGP